MVDFTTLTKADWIRLVQKELKSTPYESLIWKINDRISIEPYYTKEESDVFISPIPILKDWRIGESFDLNKNNVNATILKSLEGGVASPLFKVSNDIDQVDFDTAFKDVVFPLIFCFIEFTEDVTQETVFYTLDRLMDYSEEEHNDMVACVIMQKEMRDEIFSDLTEIYESFYLLGFSNKTTIEDVDLSLADLLKELKDTFDKLAMEDEDNFFSNCFFTFEIGKNYLFEIARLRAFSILWGNFQLAYNVINLQPPLINVVFDPSSYDDDVNLNMIRATTMAMSAAIGGASRITVLPSDINGTDFSRRIAHNVQHLLVKESYFDKVFDPAAGSYYIDTLTKKIAESAWGIFVESRS